MWYFPPADPLSRGQLCQLQRLPPGHRHVNRQTHTEKLWVQFPPETSAEEYYYFYNMYISGLLGVEGNAWYTNFAMRPPKKGKNFFQATVWEEATAHPLWTATKAQTGEP